MLEHELPLAIWHDRLGHPSDSVLLPLLKHFNLSSSNTSKSFCYPCLQGKLHKLPFSHSTSVSTFPLQLIHTDVWGPSPQISVNGFNYYVSFVDDMSKYTWLYPIKLKSDVSTVFKTFKLLVENLLSLKSKC